MVLLNKQQVRLRCFVLVPCKPTNLQSREPRDPPKLRLLEACFRICSLPLKKVFHQGLLLSPAQKSQLLLQVLGSSVTVSPPAVRIQVLSQKSFAIVLRTKEEK